MKLRPAFTMIELVFVIVIMGIIGKFGIEFISNAYRSFIYTKINNNLQSNSAMAVEVIASRLQYRIKDSIIARETSTSGFTALRNASGDNFTVLEWIGSDIDGFRGPNANPSWSGINDISVGNATNIHSPKSKSVVANGIIKNLSNNNSRFRDAALYFVGSDNDILTDFGWDANSANETYIDNQLGAMHPIKRITRNNKKFAPLLSSSSFSEVFEYYKLSWTAYAVALENVSTTTNMGDLFLYYDYQPWHGDKYTDSGRKKALLMENVDTFQFIAMGSVVKIQVCVKSPIIDGSSNQAAGGGYSICKEKTIY